MKTMVKSMARNILTKGAVLYGTGMATVVSVMAVGEDTKKAFGLDSGIAIGGVKKESLIQTLLGYLNSFLMLLGIITVVIIIITGVQLIMSQGNEEALKKAKKTLMMAAAGFALIVLSWSIVGFITSALSSTAPAGTNLTNS